MAITPNSGAASLKHRNMAVARWIDWMCEFGAAMSPITKFVKPVAYYETLFPLLG
jgi:hypothetical protein